MASTSRDSWMKEYNAATKLSNDINGMISEKTAMSGSEPDSQRHFAAVRRTITILGARLDSLEFVLSKLPSKQSITEKELNRRKDMLSNLRRKTNQMATTLNMSNFANRDSLLGPDTKPADAMTRVAGLDNRGIIDVQRQIMKEQDKGLEQLEATVKSTKHIAIAVHKNLTYTQASFRIGCLCDFLLLQENLDQHVELTGSRLQHISRSLAMLNKETKGDCSCLCLLLSVAGIVILILVIFVLIKYL